MLDQGQHQNAICQNQNVPITSVSLLREAIHHLFGLTVAKMDNYTTVSTLLLGFCVVFYDGRLPEVCEPWVLWLHTLSLCGSFALFTLSLWLAFYTIIWVVCKQFLGSCDLLFEYFGFAFRSMACTTYVFKIILRLPYYLHQF